MEKRIKLLRNFQRLLLFMVVLLNTHFYQACLTNKHFQRLTKYTLIGLGEKFISITYAFINNKNNLRKNSD